MGLSMATAEQWVRRWERQQQRYALNRDERFTVIADVVEHIASRPSAARCRRPRMRPRTLWPHGSQGGCRTRTSSPWTSTHCCWNWAGPTTPSAARFVRTEIGQDGWTDALGLDGQLDAAVSTTALHCLGTDALGRTYKDLAALLRPGGVLVNSDGLRPVDDRTAEIVRHVSRRRSERQRLLPTMTGSPGGQRPRKTPNWPVCSPTAPGGSRHPSPTTPSRCPTMSICSDERDSRT